MKIAFISLNKEKLPDPVIPLGILYIIANTPEHHQKELWDLCFEESIDEFLSNKISNFKPDVIAIGIRNVQTNSYAGINDNLNYYLSVFRKIRSLTQSKIILGGSGFSVLPEKIMNFLRPDFGIFGEGEATFDLLIDKLDNGHKNFDEIENILYFKDEQLQINKRSKNFIDINNIKSPATEYLVPNYFNFMGINSIQTKRGCIYNCTYCNYPKIEGNKCRLREPSKVVDEILLSQKRHNNINHFFIVDSVFNSPLDHSKQICRELIKAKSKTPWTCYCSPKDFDEELAVLMSKANCKGIEIGSDSGNNATLKRLQKGFDTKAIFNISKLCKQNGIKDCHTFVLATPGETVEDIRTTLSFIEELQPFCSIIMPWLNDDDSNLSTPKDQTDLLEMLGKISKNNWIIPSLNKNFDQKLFKFLRKKDFQGPLWYHINSIDLLA